jgi:drug/metabolite transporter (DMT)-like permease
MLVTSLCLLGFLALTRPRQLRVSVRDISWFAAMGALAVGTFQVLWILAVIMNGPSVASVIQCNAPIIVTLAARIIWGESLTWRKWLAIGLASAGTALLVWPASGGAIHITLVGFLVSLGSAFAYAGITLFTKRLSRDYPSWTILAYAFGLASLALLTFQFGLPVQ